MKTYTYLKSDGTKVTLSGVGTHAQVWVQNHRPITVLNRAVAVLGTDVSDWSYVGGEWRQIKNSVYTFLSPDGKKETLRGQGDPMDVWKSLGRSLGDMPPLMVPGEGTDWEFKGDGKWDQKIQLKKICEKATFYPDWEELMKTMGTFLSMVHHPDPRLSQANYNAAVKIRVGEIKAQLDALVS